MLRLEQVSLDVESAAAFGLLGAAARAAVPYLEKALAENAVVDLKPLAANARKSIEVALADFRRSADGVTVDTAVTSLRLVGIEFDAENFCAQSPRLTARYGSRWRSCRRARFRRLYGSRSLFAGQRMPVVFSFV